VNLCSFYFHNLIGKLTSSLKVPGLRSRSTGGQVTTDTGPDVRRNCGKYNSLEISLIHFKFRAPSFSPPTRKQGMSHISLFYFFPPKIPIWHRRCLTKIQLLETQRKTGLQETDIQNLQQLTDQELKSTPLYDLSRRPCQETRRQMRLASHLPFSFFLFLSWHLSFFLQSNRNLLWFLLNTTEPHDFVEGVVEIMSSCPRVILRETVRWLPEYCICREKTQPGNTVGVSVQSTQYHRRKWIVWTHTTETITEILSLVVARSRNALVGGERLWQTGLFYDCVEYIRW
jgi:hypothetical protein